MVVQARDGSEVFLDPADAENGFFTFIADAIKEYGDDYSACYAFFEGRAAEHPHGWVSKEERRKLLADFLKRETRQPNSPLFGMDVQKERKKKSDNWAFALSMFASEEMCSFNESYSGQNTGVFFREPRLLKDVVLLRFSDYEPSQWRGHEPENLGLTFHESSGEGSLSFAFRKEDLSPSEIEAHRQNYGARVFEILAPEALYVEHISDSGSRQVIFDLEDMTSVRELEVEKRPRARGKR